MKTIEGCHGTCVGAAEEIERLGFQAANVRARIGPGAYFWAFSDQPGFAAQLARAWYEQKLGSREYDQYQDKRFANVQLKLTVQDEEILDLDSVESGELLRQAHQRLRGIYDRRGEKQDVPKQEVYQATIGAVKMALAKRNPPVALKVIKVNVGLPNGFVLPFQGWLTGYSGAYIIVPEALGELVFTGATPTLRIV